MPERLASHPRGRAAVGGSAACRPGRHTSEKGAPMGDLIRLRSVSAATLEAAISEVVEYAIFVLDPEGHVVTWNKGARRLKGYEGEEILGRHFSVFYRSEERR